MKDEVPHINTKLKNSLRHFKKRAGEVAANAATMALIAENAKLYVADTKKPTEGKKWTEFAAQMRAAASRSGRQGPCRRRSRCEGRDGTS